MTSLSLVETALDSLTHDAVVVGLVKTGRGPALAPGAERLEKKVKGGLAKAFAAVGATGAAGEVSKVSTLGSVQAPLVVGVGLGSRPDDAYDPETIRRAAGAAIRALAGKRRVALTLGLSNGADRAADLRAAGEGALLGAYAFTEQKSKAPDIRPVSSIALVVGKARDKAARRAVTEAIAIGDAVTVTRDLVNLSANVLYPQSYAERVGELARDAGVRIEVLDEDDLAAGGYGGILAVGMGSVRPPRLVHLSYGSTGPTVALVGKGITFDTGGISIKPNPGMNEMRGDMGGSAAVLGTVLAAAAMELPVRLEAWLPMAENMPSGSAYRPGDIVTMRSGTTVEVLNTDAEGRMVLADGIARACEDGPDYLVETSTLTGGQVVALGHRTAGLMGSDDLVALMSAAGVRAGEASWAMPLPEDVRSSMDSPVADVSQTAQGLDRGGHMLQGGAFLSRFVAEGISWAHLDIAGPSFNSKGPWGCTPKGATGFAVRTLVALLEGLATS